MYYRNHYAEMSACLWVIQKEASQHVVSAILQVMNYVYRSDMSLGDADADAEGPGGVFFFNLQIGLKSKIFFLDHKKRILLCIKQHKYLLNSIQNTIK